jgi:hypothetical protein
MMGPIIEELAKEYELEPKVSWVLDGYERVVLIGQVRLREPV